MSNHHWIVMKGAPEGCLIYERVDYVPSPRSSRVLAEEIDGKPKAQAVAILESMFDRVKTRNGSPRIFCYKENGEMTDFDKLHYEAIEAINAATDQKTRHEAEIYLRGLRDGYSAGTGVHKGDLIMRGDMHYINQGIDRPMCGGVFLDQEADNADTSTPTS